MLSVHSNYQPFAPIPRSHATPTRRHKEVLVERGRSRTVSQAALARKKSEERRKRTAIANRPAEQPRASTSRATSTPTLESRSPSIHGAMLVQVEDEKPVVLSPSFPSREPVHASSQPVDVIDSTADDSDSRRRQRVTEPYSTSVTEAASPFSDDEESSTSVDSLSLQDQMQQAYAACQTTCLPTPGRNHCRCRNMHRARVLYLKTQGIDVTSDDDPRIDQVRDEDFVFVPGGQLVLDEESLAAINEELTRREKEIEARRCRGRKQVYEARIERNMTAKTASYRCDGGSGYTSQSFHRLEFTAKRGRLPRSNTSGLSRQCMNSTQLEESVDSAPTFHATYQTGMPQSKPHSVSFRDIVRSLHGPLFPDSELQTARSPSQERLLGALLESTDLPSTNGRRVINRGRTDVGLRTWTLSRFYQASDVDSSCIACSVNSDSTISRTNSWASASSGVSSSTCITSPPSSPKLGKLQLSLVEDNLTREQIYHSCRSHRWSGSKLTVVPLSETPLHNEGDRGEQSVLEPICRISRERKDENVASVIVSRVRQSVYGLVDFASKMQQSYLRTIQFAVTLPPDVTSLPGQSCTCSRRGQSPYKPSGYRASVSDVQSFAPYPASGPARELNLPSDLNIPLVPTYPDSDSAMPPRVFAPLAFVPPSPLRPREAPLTPEWRLRPVANPCTLRLKAHAKCLSEKGIPWEGRAHTGSLGCGRDRLTGVAFEGLGGSRLAFEAK